ncbi:putative ornithine aminotransferase, mitochondrial [Trichinella nativa]|uniref:Ornithine aminotransferase n=1 Tax=Trichinella nativa TaxID=6335 RepID=A0A0V1LSG8_9BILA|nr:putative ornithine aminotransferase, mitochondrial [Trichinella nativa]
MFRAKSQSMFDLEAKHAAHNYKPLPVALERGECLFVWDVNGRRYLAYSAVNQGHRHLKIIEALKKQDDRLILCTRATYSNVLGEYENFMTNLFGYDKLLPMNSGVECCESELKLAQRWAYDVNYPYDDPGALKQVVLSTNGSNVAAFMVEPIQGEAGVKVAKDGGYWRKVAEICQRYNMKFKLGEDVLPDQQSSTFGASETFKMEYLFHQQTHGLPSAMIKAVRSKGLLNAIEINSGYDAR